MEYTARLVTNAPWSSRCWNWQGRLPLLESRQYTEALTALAELREPVDTFFDDVMVNVEDKATRKNRLALLSQLRALFLDVADISRLSI